MESGAHAGEGRPAWAARPLPPIPPVERVVAGGGQTLESLRGESVEELEATNPQPFEITDLGEFTFLFPLS